MAKELNPDSIADDALKSYIVNGKEVGFILELGVSRYRSVPLSCIEELQLKVDGEVIDPLSITFCINNKRFMISQLKDLWAEYWNMNEKAKLVVLKTRGIGRGEHDIEIKLPVRIPYVFANDTFDIQRSETKTFSFSIDDASCAKRVKLQ
jgi:hypothetical protein